MPTTVSKMAKFGFKQGKLSTYYLYFSQYVTLILKDLRFLDEIDFLILCNICRVPSVAWDWGWGWEGGRAGRVAAAECGQSARHWACLLCFPTTYWSPDQPLTTSTPSFSADQHMPAHLDTGRRKVTCGRGLEVPTCNTSNLLLQTAKLNRLTVWVKKCGASSRVPYRVSFRVIWRPVDRRASTCQCSAVARR